MGSVDDTSELGESFARVVHAVEIALGGHILLELTGRSALDRLYGCGRVAGSTGVRGRIPRSESHRHRQLWLDHRPRVGENSGSNTLRCGLQLHGFDSCFGGRAERSDMMRQSVHQESTVALLRTSLGEGEGVSSDGASNGARDCVGGRISTARAIVDSLASGAAGVLGDLDGTSEVGRALEKRVGDESHRRV